jgi:hypothetical protein
VEKNWVYLTAAKTVAAQTIAGSGANAGKITVYTSPDPDDTSTAAATATNAVIKVDTRSLVFDGGTLEFDLTVSEGNKESRTIHVTLKVTPNLTNAAVFRVDWDKTPETPYADLDLEAGNATLIRIGPAGGDGTPGAFTGFREAFEYVDHNAEANTDYLIRVEKDELTLPRFYFIGNKQENVTLRLRGYKEPRILQAVAERSTGNIISYHDTAFDVNDLYYYMEAYYSPPSTPHQGFFTIGYSGDNFSTDKITFILENNITVKGAGKETVNDVYNNLFYIWTNATLVMKKGSALTQFKPLSGLHTHAPIVIPFHESTPSLGGRIRIEGGSITDCAVNAGGLIYFTATQSAYSPGALYKAASSNEDPVILLEGNTYTSAVWFNSEEGNTTELNTENEISLPQ